MTTREKVKWKDSSIKIPIQDLLSKQREGPLIPVKRESSVKVFVPTLDMELKTMMKESIDASEWILQGKA